VVDVVDNNDIDREVTVHRPSIVVIEALWVVPEKFEVLKRLHPKVKWIVRLHSAAPFLAMEGIAFDWLAGYRKRGITIAANDSQTASDLESVLHVDVPYLPNIYDPGVPFVSGRKCHKSRVLRVGCFGAIRPLKNQLQQAIAAIRYAEQTNRELHFFVNATRVERGEEVLKNLRGLFMSGPHHLVECEWQSHDGFMRLLRGMDFTLQVSFTETFNIVAADSVAMGIPVIVSPEIKWNPIQASPTNTDSIIAQMKRVESSRKTSVMLSQFWLRRFNKKALNDWSKFLK
jgi:hypothetical protein